MLHASITDIVADVTPAPMAHEEEARLVRLAQTGDSEAVVALMRQYAPAIRNALARFGEVLPAEDAEQEAAVAFMTLVNAHDPETGRLAGRLHEYLNEGLHEAAAKANDWSIPSRTLKRFFSVLKKADGEVSVGVDIAPENGMSKETFLFLASILRGTESIDALNARADEDGAQGADSGVYLTGDPGDPYVAVEDRALVEGLFTLLDKRETAIIRFAYGFDAIPGIDAEEAKAGVAKTREEGIAVANDSAVARATGLTRATVQRARTAALAKMRLALTSEEVAA